MVNKIPSDLSKISKYGLFSYELLFSYEKIQIFYLLNLGIFLFFYIELLFLRRSIQSKNVHDHRGLLNDLFLIIGSTLYARIMFLI